MAAPGDGATTGGDGLPFIGSLMRLISSGDVAYQGILWSIDMPNSTIALSNVRCFGTEGRRKENEVPPSDQVFEYVVFKGSEIKELTVVQPPPQQPPPAAAPPPFQDPAIVSAGPPPPSAPGGQQQHNRPPPQPRPPPVEVPKEEFNFEEALKRFNKGALEKEAEEHVPVAPIQASYTKDDFFDQLSCDTLERMGQGGGDGGGGGGGREDWRSKMAAQRKVDIETFGGAGRAGGGYRGRGRGRGYYGGRGRGGRGRGGQQQQQQSAAV